MRYDTPITMYTTTEGEYDERTGDYRSGYSTGIELVASVTDMREETQRMLFGGLRRGACVVRLQGHYDRAFDYITIDGPRRSPIRYGIHSSRRLRRGMAFFCAEELNNGVNERKNRRDGAYPGTDPGGSTR